LIKAKLTELRSSIEANKPGMHYDPL